ncbi:MAG: orotidine-5'-phosphate decarboxylase [Candidatus Methylomirabilia bacterium]
MPRLEPKDRLIVALDVESLDRAEALLAELQGVVTTFKVGARLFTAAGPQAVELVHKLGDQVFLDLKYHDIPTTVAGAIREATRQGIAMLTVHASGGSSMLRAAAEAAAETAGQLKVARPLVLAVTVLTSLDRGVLQRELNVPLSVEGHVLQLAQLARAVGLDGSVVAPGEVRMVRNGLGPGWVIVVPGVRPAGSDAHDQARMATPEATIRARADYLVVGRPITEAPDPRKAALAIVEAIARG